VKPDHDKEAPMSIHVIAVFTVKKGTEDAAAAALAKLIGPTVEEEGSLDYAVHQDQDDPTVFATVEHWASREAFDGHTATPHLRECVETMRDLLVEEAELHFTRPVDGAPRT
jgi:quinol monooxygenase YgiN